MNVAKYTRNQAGNILIHCNRSDPNRTYGNQEIHNELTHLNYNLAPNHENMTDFEFMKNRCEELGIMKRKDVNYMASWVITLPKDFKGDQKQFFQESYNFLESRYGKENIISAYVHLDETSPHMHFCFVPTIFDEKKQKVKVNAKKCINKTELKVIHKEMQNYLEEKLKTKVSILNGTTEEGNKTIKELKKQEELKSEAIRELKKDPEIRKKAQEEVKEEIKELKDLTEKAIDEYMEVTDKLATTKNENKRLKQENEKIKNTDLYKQQQQVIKELEEENKILSKFKKLYNWLTKSIINHFRRNELREEVINTITLPLSSDDEHIADNVYGDLQKEFNSQESQGEYEEEFEDEE